MLRTANVPVHLLTACVPRRSSIAYQTFNTPSAPMEWARCGVQGFNPWWGAGVKPLPAEGIPRILPYTSISSPLSILYSLWLACTQRGMALGLYMRRPSALMCMLRQAST